jgi:HAD superfamily hydrolase (TIGR01509 family)
MNDVKAVVLDIDGTLLDSNEAHARAYVEAASVLGIASDFKKILRLIGKGGDKLIPEAFGFDSESDAGKKLGALKGAIFKTKFLPTLRPTPGARELLRRFRGDGFRLVVATSAGKDDVDSLLEQATVKDLMEEIVSADDMDASKPEPDVVMAALNKVDAKPNEAVMLGDTPYDVQAARRAGVSIVAVRSGGWSSKDLEDAIEVYQDPADLLACYEKSVFGRHRARKTG